MNDCSNNTNGVDEVVWYGQNYENVCDGDKAKEN